MGPTCFHCGQTLPLSDAYGPTALAAWLDASGRSRKDFAAAIGISDRALRYLASGRNTPSVTVALAIELLTDGHVRRGSWRKSPRAARGNNGPSLTAEEGH